MIESVRPFVSDLPLAIGVVVGLFLVWLGWIVLGLADPGSGQDVGQILRSFGLFILTTVMLLGGLIRVDMEKWVRVSLVIGAVLLITWEGFWVF